MSGNTSFAFSSLLLDHCMKFNTALNIVRVILLLPLSIFILYLGFQRWRQHSLKTANHSDLFAYHLAAMELIWVLGWLCSTYAKYTKVSELLYAGYWFTLIVFYGEILFHILTCVERYLAVVHPVIYMGLKNSRGVRIRNISIGCVWVLCIAFASIHVFEPYNDIPVALLCLVAVSIIITSFGSVSVLCVLIRPGPGDGGREKERVDQSKQRAFHTITAISATLWLWFVGLLVGVSVKSSHSVNSDVTCLITSSLVLCNIPSYLVSPLLYLLRAGKLTFRCCSRESMSRVS